MSRQYVKYKNKWAVFSTVVDSFIIEFMNEEEIDIWREHEYGNNLNPKEDNLKTMEDALYSIRLNRTHEESVKELISTGFNKKEAELLINSIEDKYYKPKEKNGKYYCPNCGEEVSSEQTICSDETCEMELMFGEMRNLTKEEQEALSKGLSEISQDTGINLFD